MLGNQKALVWTWNLLLEIWDLLWLAFGNLAICFCFECIWYSSFPSFVICFFFFVLVILTRSSIIYDGLLQIMAGVVQWSSCWAIRKQTVSIYDILVAVTISGVLPTLFQRINAEVIDFTMTGAIGVCKKKSYQLFFCRVLNFFTDFFCFFW